MSAVAGAFPWSKSYSKDGLEYDYATGWHKPRKTGWQKQASAKKIKTRDQYGNEAESLSYHTRVLYSPDGTKHRVKVYGLNNEDKSMVPTLKGTIWYQAGNVQDLDKELAAAEHAFEGEHKDEVKGCGHITNLEYAMENDGSKVGIMRVTFLNGDICLFFNVPPAVYGTLKHHALRKTTCGYYKARGGTQQRHLLGVEFWNLVRIRGRSRGAKFPFSYERKAEGKIVRHRERRIISLTPELLDIIQKKSNSDYWIRMRRNLKSNDKIQVVLTDEEIADLIDEMDLQLAERERNLEGSGVFTMQESENYDSNGNAISISDVVGTGGDFAASRVQNDIGSKNTDLAYLARQKKLDEMGASIRTQIGEQLFEQVKKAADDFIHSGKFTSAVARLKLDEDIPEYIAQSRVLRHWFYNTDDPLIKTLNLNTGSLKKRYGPDTPEKLGRVFERDLFGKYMQQYLPAYKGMSYTGVVWTPQKLIDFANPAVPGNIEQRHAKAYQKFIKNKDWQGALNFLKTKKFKYDYTKSSWSGDRNEKGKKYRENISTYKYITYAGPDDTLVIE